MRSQVVFISGASSGIGTAIAQECFDQGAVVALGFHTGETKIQKFIQENGNSDRLIPLEFDVTQKEQVQSAVERCILKTDRIDSLVCAAGIHISGPLIALEDQEIRKQLDINLYGAISVTHSVLPYMIRKRSGSIVHIGSVSAHRMIRGHSVYSASKAGLEGFTKALAREVAKRSIRVNCVVPGPVDTPMLQEAIEKTGDDPTQRIPLGRLVTTQEIAKTVSFLISEPSSIITGTCIPVDGGYLL